MKPPQNLLGLVAAILLSQTPVCSQQPANGKKQPTEVANVDGYFGGLPFYTAFHQVTTTRLLLLKATSTIPELKIHLQVTTDQLAKISKLTITENGTLNDRERNTLLDPNIAVDEHLIDPDFYGFLTDKQLELLDRLSLEFDGMAGLSRKSIADRLRLTEETREAVSKTLVSFRKNTWLPFFRYEFAAKLPADHDYRKCVFIGKYLMGLNKEIAKQLSKDESRTWNEWVRQTTPPYGVIRAIRRAAPLPNGLFALYQADGG